MEWHRIRMWNRKMLGFKCNGAASINRFICFEKMRSIRGCRKCISTTREVVRSSYSRCKLNHNLQRLNFYELFPLSLRRLETVGVGGQNTWSLMWMSFMNATSQRNNCSWQSGVSTKSFTRDLRVFRITWDMLFAFRCSLNISTALPLLYHRFSVISIRITMGALTRRIQYIPSEWYSLVFSCWPMSIVIEAESETAVKIRIKYIFSAVFPTVPGLTIDFHASQDFKILSQRRNLEQIRTIYNFQSTQM